MRVGRYDITVKNILSYIQGNTRKILSDFGPEIFKSPKHIQEQIVWRDVIHNPTCSNKGRCVLPEGNPCNCSIPEKFYADKACEGGCYPKIMDELTWYKFKQLAARDNINIYNDDVNWKELIERANDMSDVEYSSIISSKQSIKKIGPIPQGVKKTGYMEIFNPYKESLKVNNILPSCSCIKTEIPDSIDYNSYGKIKFTLNTNNKSKGNHEVWLTVRYNKIKRINLKIEFTVV